MNYWEKTVEYMYVISLVRSGKLKLAVPLAGKEERGAGDAVFGLEGNLLLVEFKANKTEIYKDSEKIFDDFEGALKALLHRDNHHLIVFAAPSEADVNLNLASQTYFSAKDVPIEFSVDHGVNKQLFDDYLGALLKFKKADGRSSSGVVASDFDLVLGAVSGELRALPLGEYIKNFAPTLALNLEQSQLNSSAGPGQSKRKFRI